MTVLSGFTLSLQNRHVLKLRLNIIHSSFTVAKKKTANKYHFFLQQGIGIEPEKNIFNNTIRIIPYGKQTASFMASLRICM